MVQDGEYVEGLEVVAWESSDPASGYLMAGAYERPGVYTLTITRAGYQTWVASGLVAEAGQCHVAGVSVQALLEAT